jgi:hypothetical protein
MRALSFWKAVTMDKTDFLEGVLSLLRDNDIRFCVIGGQAVNAYVEPLVSLDLDLVVAVDQIEHAKILMEAKFDVEQLPHSFNISAEGSNLRVQIQTDLRYGGFVDHASEREVLGVMLAVAAIEDVLQGKIWAATNEQRRPTKRRKDLLDIERILESQPRLRSVVPEQILQKLSEP